MAIFDELRQIRYGMADHILPRRRYPFSATEVTRLGAWCCFLGAVAYFVGHPRAAGGLVAIALVLDTFDGVVARSNGECFSEMDWAADRAGEAVFIGALFVGAPLGVALVYALAYVANVFLPRGKIPVLPLRHALVGYLLLFANG